MLAISFDLKAAPVAMKYRHTAFGVSNMTSHADARVRKVGLIVSHIRILLLRISRNDGIIVGY